MLVSLFLFHFVQKIILNKVNRRMLQSMILQFPFYYIIIKQKRTGKITVLFY